MRLGPIVGITLIVTELDAALEFYSSHLGIGTEAERKPFAAERALAMGETRLAGAKSALLGFQEWIELIEVPTALPRGSTPGWMAMSLTSPGPDTLRELDGPGGECVGCIPGDMTRILGVTVACIDTVRAQAFYRGLGLLDGAGRNTPNLRGGQMLRFWRADATAPPELHTGIYMVSFARSDATGRRQQGFEDPSARILSGAEGEKIELV